MKKQIKIFFKLIIKNYLYLIFLVSAIGMFGSLYSSDVLGLEACSLCYIQRWILYPMVFFSVINIVFKKKIISIYIFLLLGIVGTSIALYHNIIQLTKTESAVCSLGSVSCSKVDPLNILGIEFSIPFLSFTAFLFITLLAMIVILAKRKQRVVIV